jgi:hypothetical protein
MTQSANRSLAALDHLLESAIFLLPRGGANSAKERSLDLAGSRLGKYLRQKALWHLDKDLTSDDGERLIRELVTILRGNYLTGVPTEQNQPRDSIAGWSVAMETRRRHSPAPRSDTHE